MRNCFAELMTFSWDELGFDGSMALVFLLFRQMHFAIGKKHILQSDESIFQVMSFVWEAWLWPLF